MEEEKWLRQNQAYESDLSHSHHLRADRLCLALTPGKRRKGHMSASALSKSETSDGGGGGEYGKGPKHANGPVSDTNLDVPIDGGYQ